MSPLAPSTRGSAVPGHDTEFEAEWARQYSEALERPTGALLRSHERESHEAELEPELVQVGGAQVSTKEGAEPEPEGMSQGVAADKAYEQGAGLLRCARPASRQVHGQSRAKQNRANMLHDIVGWRRWRELA